MGRHLLGEHFEEVPTPDEMLDRGGKARSGLRGDEDLTDVRIGPIHDDDVGDELVSLAVHGPDDALQAAVVADDLSSGLDLGGQSGLAHESVSPDLVQQLLLANDLAPALNEK
jgi:hypothetical protein